jgi:hypothetical protein
MGKNDKKLTVKLFVGKQEEGQREGEGDSSISYSIDVETDGKYSRKATYDDLNRFTGKEITADVLKDWVVEYQRKCYPEDLEDPNHAPAKCFIKDEKKECSIYKEFGWKSIKLNLKPAAVEIKEQRTNEVCLKRLPFDFVQTKERILEQTECDEEITTYLKKSKLIGHPLAKELMTDGRDDETNIVTALEDGMQSTTFGVFGGGGQQIASKSSVETDEDTGDRTWKDAKTVRALLRDVDFPTKERGNSREANYCVTANECLVKARVHYKAFLSNDVVTIHPGNFCGKPYWKFPIKFLLQYNDEPNAILLHEDIELKFYTDVRVSMENKDWVWIKDETNNGNWKKEKIEASSVAANAA